MLCYIQLQPVFPHESWHRGGEQVTVRIGKAPKAPKAPSNHARGSFGSNSRILGYNRKLTSPTCGWATIAIVCSCAISGWQIITSSLKFSMRTCLQGHDLHTSDRRNPGGKNASARTNLGFFFLKTTDCSASLLAQDPRRFLPLSQANSSHSFPV